MTKQTCGIYKITNKTNGKAYIGASKEIERRWISHKTRNYHSTISKLIDELGKENFTFEIIKECPVENLREEEQKYIQIYGTEEPNGYNKSKGGEYNINSTGFFRVDKTKKLDIRIGYLFRYHYKENGKLINIAAMNILELQKKVEAKNLPWKITDNEKANKTLKQNKQDLENIRPKKPSKENNTGYYHVFKFQSKNCVQGYLWAYYYEEENGILKFIGRVDLNKLKEVVKSKGLPWKIIDEEKARLSDEENKLNEHLHTNGNTTGFYRVGKNKSKKTSQGFVWVYTYKENGVKKTLSRTNFFKLKKAVKEKGLPWKIINESLARDTLNSIESNISPNTLDSFY